MKLIVGLGNPGDVYSDSRHNIGFRVIKALSSFYKAALKRDSGTYSFTSKVKIGGNSVVLAIPVTFMNLSGSAVKPLLKKYKIGLEDLLVVCDDLDLELGRLKIKPSGSSAGHRGIQSIIDSLASNEFARLRIGIDRPGRGIEASLYVLSRFSRKEKEPVCEIVEKAKECCQSWVIGGIKETMNIFNKRSGSNE